MNVKKEVKNLVGILICALTFIPVVTLVLIYMVTKWAWAGLFRE